jgi:hypothetical protein
MDRRKTGGIGLDYEMDTASADATDGPGDLDKTQKEMVVACNRNLIEYFARLGQSKDEEECINLEFVENLLWSGARIDCTDKYGQTIFHEVRILVLFYVFYFSYDSMFPGSTCVAHRCGSVPLRSESRYQCR